MTWVLGDERLNFTLKQNNLIDLYIDVQTNSLDRAAI